MNLNALQSAIIRRQGEMALAALRRPDVEHPEFEYGRMVGVISGFQIVIDLIDNILNEEETKNRLL
jgi:hypothetical protein